MTRRLSPPARVVTWLIALLLAVSAWAEGVSWSVGDEVMALGKDGGWYYAKILEVKGDLYRVDMLGVSKEWMDASRIRPQSADDIRAVTPTQDAPASATAEAKTGDARVAAALKDAGFDWKIDSDGDYKLEVSTTSDRTQLVWVISSTQKWGDLEIREVWSPAFRTQGHLDLAMARRLLSENNAKKLGAWRILGTGDKETAVFAVHLDANANGAVLKDVIDLVKKVADDMEREVVGTDDM